jgi:hypothetical protein
MNFKEGYKIGGHVFYLRQVSKDDIDGGVGDCDRDKGVIRVSKDLLRSHQEQTFFHEVMHIINWEMDEEKIEFLSQAIYAFLTENDMLK